MVQGLWVEAARWDQRSKMLKQARPSQLLEPMPLLHLLPSQAAATGATAAEGHGASGAGRRRSDGEDVGASGRGLAGPCIYDCPLYKTSARQGTVSTTGQSSNLVIIVQLPAHGEPGAWVLQGTCLLCQTDD